jgi:hypothetical protein
MFTFKIERNPNGTYAVIAIDTDRNTEQVANDGLTRRDALEYVDRENAREDAFQRGETATVGYPNNEQLIIDQGMIPRDYL